MLFIEVHSVNDVKYVEGEKLEKYIVENGYGGISHFFDEEHLRNFSNNFKIIKIEERSWINSDNGMNITYVLIAKK